MKATTQYVTVFVAAMVLGFATSSALSAEAQKEGGAPAKPPTTRPSGGFNLKYKPVVKDAPASRGWGAARGTQKTENPPPHIYVLAPEDFLGTTSREQPTLYWYISEPTKRTIDIAITPLDDPDAKRTRLADPILSVSLKGIEKPGLQALDLSKAKGPGGKPAALKKGVKYKWVIELLLSEAEGAHNPFAECMLKRVDAPPAVQDTAMSAASAAAAYAEAGIWYDAVADLNRAIADNPDDKALRDARRELLKQHRLIEDEQGKIRDEK